MNFSQVPMDVSLKSNASVRTEAIPVISFLLCQERRPGLFDGARFELPKGATGLTHEFVSPNGRLSGIYTVRHPSANVGPLTSSSHIRLLYGDPGGFHAGQEAAPMGSAALIEYEPESGEVTLFNSIVGLPPVYLYETEYRRIITSDLFLLAAALPRELSFDPDGVADLCSYGYPVNFRTLYRNVNLTQGGTSIALSATGEIRAERIWQFPDPEPLPDWNSYSSLQEQAFRQVLSEMDLSQAFLSLTAGLDTRTILAVLTGSGRMIPAYTMSGANWSVDARAANALCRAYGIRHEVVLLDNEFLSCLPELVREASRLSGGVASLEQSHDVYLYRKAGPSFSARLSGNMGNQLGRKGVEHVSMRGADTSLLNEDLKNRSRERSRSPWFQEGLSTHAVYEFLLQQEAPFTLAGNFSIGHHFATQLSPYANRALFELCPRQPIETPRTAPSSIWRLRLNDLRHRFLWGPEERSFQRRLIRETGGAVASHPINWGWRAKGGVSPSGAILGMLSMLDALAVRQRLHSGLPGAVLRNARVTGLHEYRDWRLWMRTTLREFVHDTLLSTRVRQSGLFDERVLSQMLEEHYSDKVNHHNALILSLDLGIAVEEFGASYR
jgi:hypothetical protein